MQGLWRLVDGRMSRPDEKSSPDEAQEWDLKSDKAAGTIHSTISIDLKVHVRAAGDDPTKMWNALKDLFIQQKTTPCINAYHESKMKEKAQPAEIRPSSQDQASVASVTSALHSAFPCQSSYTSWNADSGASSHMTPHRHWMRNYKPYKVPIQLANGDTIYSAGVGSVLFQPVVHGKTLRAVEFTEVLHVPDLRNNLISVLFLSKHRHFHITIVNDTISFKRYGRCLFTASVNEHNTAYLQGYTLPVTELANLSSSPTLPLDLSLWHRRLCHHNILGVRKLIKDDMVTGLEIDSPDKPDPICEPCIAGKLHANPFPSSTSRTTRPLELIHSDVHGPLKVSTHSGYRYWVLYIDDYTRIWVAYPMKKKSDNFAAFQQFKALVENQVGEKIQALRDDKGGEYMSKEFNDYCAANGIV